MNKSDCCNLGSLANIVMGQSPEGSAVTSEEVGLPFLQGCAEFGNQHPAAEVYCSPPLRIAPTNSILISVRAPVGTMNLADRTYCIGRGLASIAPKAQGTPIGFLKYAIDQNVQFLHRRSQGSTFLAISRDDLDRLPIPDLSPKQQQKIAAILETMDEAIEQTEALIAKYEQIKAGMMQDLFTRGLTPDGKLRPQRHEAPDLYKETPIGWIPKEWDIKELVKLVHFQRGYDIVEASLEPGDFPVISSGGVIGHHSSCTSKGPGVLVGRKGTIGKVHYSERDYWAHDTSLYSTDFFGNEPKFIYYLCHWLDLARFGTKSGSPSLNRNDIHPLQVGRPLDVEQNEIALRIDCVVAHSKALSRELRKLRQQKSGLMHDLLTGTVPLKV